MKAVFEKVDIGFGLSFSVKEFTIPEFDAPWHFHPELELTYIVKSRGNRFVGDKVEEFAENDLVLIGPNLPHLWQNPSNQAGDSQAIVIHFSANLLQTSMKSIPEFESIHLLLEESATGLVFEREAAAVAGREMHRMATLPPFERLIAFLNLLQKLATAAGKRTLASPGYIPRTTEKDAEQLAVVFEYVRKHFHENLRLTDVAALIHLTPPAFCRFFKKRVKKTFFEFLNEFRIGNACRLLIETNMKVTEASFRSGFYNIAHFNKQFKKITGHSPVKYRLQHGVGSGDR